MCLGKRSSDSWVFVVYINVYCIRDHMFVVNSFILLYANKDKFVGPTYTQRIILRFNERILFSTKQSMGWSVERRSGSNSSESLCVEEWCVVMQQPHLAL